jgi:putative cell wall-binding protein
MTKEEKIEELEKKKVIIVSGGDDSVSEKISNLIKE